MYRCLRENTKTQRKRKWNKIQKKKHFHASDLPLRHGDVNRLSANFNSGAKSDQKIWSDYCKTSTKKMVRPLPNFTKKYGFNIDANGTKQSIESTYIFASTYPLHWCQKNIICCNILLECMSVLWEFSLRRKAICKLEQSWSDILFSRVIKGGRDCHNVSKSDI